MSDPTAGPDDEARFRSVYDAAYADVLRFVQRRVDPSHAEDLTADTFLLWLPGDDLREAPRDGVDVEVVLRDGSTGRVQLRL